MKRFLFNAHFVQNRGERKHWRIGYQPLLITKLVSFTALSKTGITCH